MFWSVRPHWQDTAVIDEFHPYHDDCGPNALENTAGNLEGRSPTYQNMDDIRADMIARGWFNGGCTTDQLAAECGVRGYPPVKVWPYNPNGYSAADVRSALEQCPDGNHALIAELGAAGRLPMNQPYVNGHFIALLAYDSTPVRNAGQTGKALVANGDRVPVGGPDWLWIDDIAGADVIGMILVARKGTTSTHTGGGTVANTTGLGAGFAAVAEQRGADVRIPEQYEQGGYSWATLTDGTILHYDAAQGVYASPPLPMVAGLLEQVQALRTSAESQAENLQNELAAAQQQLAAAQSEETAEVPAPTPAPEPDPKATAALAVLQQLKSVLSEV